MPKRIQRKRTKGWRMPPNTIYVGRSTKWGNPIEVNTPKKDIRWRLFDGQEASHSGAVDAFERLVFAAQKSKKNTMVYCYRQRQRVHFRRLPPGDKRIRLIAAVVYDLEELRGKDLACWCPLDKPCHADVLIKLANR
ncbi:MAG: DUF4326 domain-containing protein [Pseudomonadota bacterium]